jgi:hypothetical protein
MVRRQREAAGDGKREVVAMKSEEMQDVISVREACRKATEMRRGLHVDQLND